MNIRVQLLATMALLGALLFLPSLYALRGLEELRELASDLHERQAQAALEVGEARVALGELDRQLRSHVVVPDPASRRAAERALRRARVASRRLVQLGYAAPGEALSGSLDEVQATSEDVLEKIENHRVAAATAGLHGALSSLDEARAGIGPVADAIERDRRTAVERARAISTGSDLLVRLFGTLGLASALLLGLRTTRRIVDPVHRLRDATAKVASGRFEAPADLPYDRPDELGDLARAFRAMTVELAELERLRAEFVSVTSHELKTPLNVIGGYAEILDEGQFGELTEEQRATLRTISDQVGLLTRLVNQLLDLSRHEAGGLDLTRDEVNVADLMAGIAQAFGPLARRHGVQLGVEIDAAAPESVWGDHDRLHNEVVGNLVSNAFKFTPPGGRVTIHATRDPGGLRIDVLDDGEGIPPDLLPHVFDKFWRGDAGRPGAGLGLAIARDVIRAHGGRIGVDSEPAWGSRFWFTVPVRSIDERSGEEGAPVERLGPLLGSTG